MVRVGAESARCVRRGAALLETLFGVMVLMVGLGAGVLALLSAMSLARAARERSHALQGAESAVEALMSENFREVFARYNATNLDDPDPLTGPSPGDRFDVEGLTPVAGEPSVGRILFPSDDASLFEDVFDDALGMPRDLTLDGTIDDQDHAADYRILPAIVSVRWRGVLGEEEVRLATTLVDRAKVTE